MTETTTTTGAMRDRIAAELIAARERTTLLTTAVDEPDLIRQHSPLMSPLVWDLAHIANQEELWLLREVGGRSPMHPQIDALYDAFEHPRSQRPSLPLLAPAEARAYGHEVRGRVLDLLEKARFGDTRLTADGFGFGMVAQHEVQHDETMLATHQLRAGPPTLTAAPPGPAPADAATLPAEVLVPGGPFTMGTSAEPWALDNERPAHQVHVPAFYLDTTPVTSGAYAEFIAGGGYDDPRWWRADGWAHRQRAGLFAPLFWQRDGGQWLRTEFGVTAPVVADEPVMHVCWYEADAYARWAGRRLPTEAEWEKAARFDPATQESRRYPWGNADPTPEVANLGQRHLRPAPAGSYPAGAAPCGARQLIGDVWEWTSSDFTPYPGFEAWPYKEYSQVFFGPEYKVLRGGAFGVSPVACRGTFRNWDYPIRRQIFAGFRTARSAGAAAARPRLMCRHVAYLGPPATLRSLLIDPPHGLYRQSWAPRAQRNGTVNADGFGVGWYAGGDPVPARYRRDCPIWGDASLPDIARVTRSAAVLAAVRSATPGMAPGEAAAAPLASGTWLFSHNGVMDGWPGSAGRLPVTAEALASMEAVTDSALLWALVTGRLQAGADPGAALAATIGAVEAAGVCGRFNFLLTDGVTIAATACGDTLWYRAGAAAVVVASEPSDDGPGWIEVPGRHVLSAVPGRVDVRPLDAPASPPATLPPQAATSPLASPTPQTA